MTRSDQRMPSEMGTAPDSSEAWARAALAGHPWPKLDDGFAARLLQLAELSPDDAVADGRGAPVVVLDRVPAAREAQRGRRQVWATVALLVAIASLGTWALWQSALTTGPGDGGVTEPEVPWATDLPAADAYGVSPDIGGPVAGVPHLGDKVAGVATRGNYAYLAIGAQIWVLDLTAADRPQLVARTPSLGDSVALIATTNEHLIVVTGPLPFYGVRDDTRRSRMLAFDLVNPATPKLVGAPLQLDGVVQSLAAAGDVVYVGMVTDSRSGQTLPELAKLQTVEVTAHGASPVADMPYDGDMGRILALPGRVVVLSGLDIYLLGADDPLRPVGWDRRSLYEEADRAALPPGEHRSMYQYRNAVSGKALYMPVETRRAEDSDMHSGLVVIDVPSESQPYPTPKFIPWATGLIQRVALADDVLVVSSLMDVPPPGTDTCRLIGLDSSTMAHGGLDVELPEPVACDGQVAAANGVLVVASDGARTVYLVDPRRTPALFSQISLPRRESGMLFDKGLIYRADGRGLTVLDAAEDASGEIALRGHLAWPNEGGEITSMVVQDGVLYAASSMPDMVDSAIRPHGGALRIVDVADPGAPRLLSTWSAPGHLQSMVVVGKQGYVVQSIDESCGDGCTGSQEYLTALDLDDLLSPQPGWMYQPMLSAVLAGIPDHVLQYDFCMPSSTELVPCVIVDGLNKAGTASGTNSVHLPDTDFFEAPAMTVGGANKHLVLKSRTPQGRATLYDVDLRDLSRLSARPLELPSYKELEGSWNVPNLHFAIGGTTLFAMEERDDGLFALDLAQPGAWQRRAATVSGDEFYHLATDGNRLAVISDVGLWLLPVDEARR